MRRKDILGNFMEYKELKGQVRLSEKMTLTVEEAAALSGVGISRIREITDDPDCEFVLFVGRKKLIKRIPFQEYLYKVKRL